jgi:arylsulfate sulfotransferase
MGVNVLRFYVARVSCVLAGGALFIGLMTGCGVVPKAPSGNPQTAVSKTQNSLVAKYQVNQLGPANVWVDFGTDTSYGRQTESLSSASPAGPGEPAALFQNTILVAGMKPNTTYHMRAHVDFADGSSWVDQDQTFKTGSIPEISATFTITQPAQSTGSRTLPLQGVEMLDLISSDPNILKPIITDLQGNIIWYYEATEAFPMKLLSNGHMLVNITNGLTGPSLLREIDLAGDVIRELSIQELNQKLAGSGFPSDLMQVHHDVLPLPNGHLILLGNRTVPYTDLTGFPGTTKVLGDVLVDLDSDWNPVWFWSAFDHLDVNRHLQGLPDWTHANGLVYTPNDGNLLLSVRHQSWILKIDYSNGNGTGDILWRLGEEGDFAIAGGDPSQWFYAQHYPNLLNLSGTKLTLAIVDNGDLRIDSTGATCGLLPPAPCYSRATIFQVDEAARSATVLWQYLPGFYSFWGGSIDLVDNGNVEFDMSAPLGFASASRIMEVTQDANPSIVWQMDINGANAYRGNRIPSLYPGVTW